MAEVTVTQREALDRARNGNSLANLGAIFDGFTARGIPAAEIIPRVNVLTFNAWKALGRHVRKGEHGVHVTTWVEMSKKSDDGEPSATFRRPRTTTVFHVTQTDPIQ